MILSCGEALIDFVPVRAADGGWAYRPAIGGSLYNVALTMGRLGARVGFLGALSTDIFGEQLIEGLRKSMVDLDYTTRSDEPSTLAFVSLGDGEPEYAFFDELTSSRMWSRTRAPRIGDDVSVIHFGSISLLNEPGGSERLALLQAEASRRVISFDPNIRPTMIKDEASYRARLDQIFSTAHLVKISAADLEWLRPGLAPDEAARSILAANARLVVVTMGGKGAYAWGRAATAFVPVEPVEVVDTVGAGDSFMGGLLTWLQEHDAHSIAGLESLDASELRAALSFAARVASITCGRQGADPPWRHELGLVASGI